MTFSVGETDVLSLCVFSGLEVSNQFVIFLPHFRILLELSLYVQDYKLDVVGETGPMSSCLDCKPMVHIKNKFAHYL